MMFCLLFGFSNAATPGWYASSTWGFIVLQKTKRQPIVLRNPTEDLRVGPD